MRIRLAAAVTAVAAAALLLSGCADAGTPSASPSPSASSGCLLNAKPGKASDAVKVEGSGKDLTVTVPSGTDIDSGNVAQRTVISKSKSAEIANGDLVSIQYRVVDPSNNSVLGSSDTATDVAQPWIFGADSSQPTILDIALECEPVGTAVVLTVPGSLRGQGQPSLVVYAQAVKKLPTVATGTPVAPVAGMPTVKLAKNGAPTITIPKTDKPTETKVEDLKQGDGATVASTDSVIVQYTGVNWDEGKVFDSSWKRGAPTQFSISGVVPGSRRRSWGRRSALRCSRSSPRPTATATRGADRSPRTRRWCSSSTFSEPFPPPQRSDLAGAALSPVVPRCSVRAARLG